MVRLTLLLLVSIVFVPLVSSQKNEISESEFLAKETFAIGAIPKQNRKLVRTLEYFEERSQPGHLSERFTEEVILPKKRREINETDYNGKKTREERIWDGTGLYVKRDDGEWQRFSGGTGTSARIESGRVTKKYRYLGKVDLDGRQTDLYQVQSVREANKFSATDMVVIKYVRDTHYWFDSKGWLLKKVEETMIEGRPQMSRETTTIEYEPKIGIDAPIK